jgi:NADH-quinone oxidoreductase subunit K
MTVAAAEAAVGLALMIAFYKNKESIDVEEINLMRL